MLMKATDSPNSGVTKLRYTYLGVILKLRSSTGGGRGVSKTYVNLRWGGGGHKKNLRSFFA